MADKATREIRIVLPEELFNFLVPSEAQAHLNRARKEVLLALRSVIDARIESLERREARGDAPKRKIKVE
jgi:hypothetical protein